MAVDAFTPKLLKQPWEEMLFDFDFSARLASGVTIASVVSIAAAPSGLTMIGSPAFSGSRAQQKIGGGTTGVDYVVTARVIDSLGSKLESEGVLQVREIG